MNDTAAVWPSGPADVVPSFAIIVVFIVLVIPCWALGVRYSWYLCSPAERRAWERHYYWLLCAPATVVTPAWACLYGVLHWAWGVACVRATMACTVFACWLPIACRNLNLYCDCVEACDYCYHGRRGPSKETEGPPAYVTDDEHRGDHDPPPLYMV